MHKRLPNVGSLKWPLFHLWTLRQFAMPKLTNGASLGKFEKASIEETDMVMVICHFATGSIWRWIRASISDCFSHRWNRSLSHLRCNEMQLLHFLHKVTIHVESLYYPTILPLYMRIMLSEADRLWLWIRHLHKLQSYIDPRWGSDLWS